jgi:hypothetical protein
MQSVALTDPPLAHTLAPDVPPALSALVRRLLSPAPHQRPCSARAVADELRSLEDSLGAAKTPSRQPK